MCLPQLNYRFNDQKTEVACSVSFVPTFEPPQQPQDAIMTSEDLESTPLSKGSDFCFIFLVDRSGSMHGSRIETTKVALKLFIQSLPVGSSFAILGFGTDSQWCLNTQVVLPK